MKLIFSTVLLLSTMLLFAQTSFDLDQDIPKDPKVSIGVLDNGMSYYVRSNETPKNRAELMLVVRAGSVDEDDDQQGLAHFAEHMSFNGTKNFPKHELINYFESIGMDFGAEINAYTSFDETVYTLTVPLDSAVFMDQGLQVLYDWASQNTDSDEEINNERGIITEEQRRGRGADDRMMQNWMPVFLHNSKYAQRLPIGKMDVVNNCPPEALRRYRKDWYRPDLQAIIVVGDFNQEEMVNTVKEKFSAIPKAVNPREKKYYDIPDHKETFVSINTDKEARYPLAYVYYKHPFESAVKVNDYREMIKEGIYNGMINKRLAEKTQQAEPPFLMGQSAYTELFGPKSTYMSVAVTQGDKIEKGLTAVLIENERVKKFGFTESELERQKTAMLNSIEKAYNERANQKSKNYANEYKRNFLPTNESFPGIETEYEYYKAFLPTIKVEEINELATKWVTDENRVVIITAPENEQTKVPTEEEVLSLLDDVKEIEITPYEDAVANVPLIADEPVGSKVSAEKNIENVEAVEWKLENGATVVFKTTDFKDDEILFNAWSLGGNSLYGMDDDISASLTTGLIGMSGISEFNKITLDKLNSGKVFSVNPYISSLREGFNGRSSVKDVETMLQMVYLYFTEPRFDDVSYQSLMTQYKTILENKSASPESALRDTFTVVSANYHERSRPMTVELLKEANFDRMKVIGKERFKNAADFKFFFVGNIDVETLKPLVEKYIGGIPSVEGTENWVDLGIDKPEGVVERLVKKGQEEKSTQYIVFHGDFDYTGQNRVQLNAMGRILTTKLLEVIREDKSGVYSIGARPGSTKFPDEKYTVSISYGTSPDKLEDLKSAVFEVIKEFAKKGPTEDELAKAKEKMLRERETQVRENGYWLNILANTYYLKNGDFSEYGAYEELVNNLTVKSTKKAFKNYFDFKQYIDVALAPAE